MIRSSAYGSPRRAGQRSRKWPGKLTPFDGQPGAPRHFHVEQRQRDRDAGAPIEHFVQEAVARILVVHLVADEAHLAEQILVQRHHLRVAIGIDSRRRLAGGCRRVVDAAPRFLADRVELVEIRARVEGWIFDARDHQRRDGEVGVGAERGVGEAPDQLGADHWGQDSKNAAVGRSAQSARLKPSRYSKTTSRERLQRHVTAAASRYVYIFRATVNASRYEYRRDSAPRSSDRVSR